MSVSIHIESLRLQKTSILFVSVVQTGKLSKPGHCIDYLRQYVQCHADLTPMTYEFHGGGGGGLRLVPGKMHTCRNFDQIHDWIMDQGPVWYSADNVTRDDYNVEPHI